MRINFFRVLPLFAFAIVALHAADDAQLATLRAADDERVAAILAADKPRLAAIFSDEMRYAHSTCSTSCSAAAQTR